MCPRQPLENKSDFCNCTFFDTFWHHAKLLKKCVCYFVCSSVISCLILKICATFLFQWLFFFINKKAKKLNETGLRILHGVKKCPKSKIAKIAFNFWRLPWTHFLDYIQPIYLFGILNMSIIQIYIKLFNISYLVDTICKNVSFFFLGLYVR